MKNTSSFRLKVFFCIIFSTLITLAVALTYLLSYWQKDLIVTAKTQATTQVKLIASLLNTNTLPHDLAKLKLEKLRLTLVDPQGKVIFDSNFASTQLAQLDNHNDRPEIKAALTGQDDVYIRYSNTEQSSLVYAATQLSNGDVLRIAMPHSSLLQKIDASFSLVLGVAFSSVILAMLLAYFLSKQLQNSLAKMIKVIESISLGHYQRRLQVIPGQEFAPLAEAVNRMATNIEESFQVRRDFVANVSHELRTPLTAIQGYTETLLNINELDPDCQRFLKIISKHSLYMTKMVEELLTLARLENSVEALQLQKLIPYEQVQGILNYYRDTIHAKEITIEQNIDPNLQIMANALHLEQVWRNLMENALQYAPSKSIIRVQGTITDNMIVFSVSDQGIGLDSFNLQRIFERFFQVSKHRQGPSTGLGLAICKHIVEKHQGKIWAISPNGDFSTTIAFSLPLNQECLAKPMDKKS